MHWSNKENEKNLKLIVHIFSTPLFKQNPIIGRIVNILLLSFSSSRHNLGFCQKDECITTATQLKQFQLPVVNNYFRMKFISQRYQIHTISLTNKIQFLDGWMAGVVKGTARIPIGWEMCKKRHYNSIIWFLDYVIYFQIQFPVSFFYMFPRIKYLFSIFFL